MGNDGYEARFIWRILRLHRQLNKYHLEIDQISGGDSLPVEIPAEDRQEMQATIEGLRFMDQMPGGFLVCYAADDEEIIYANRGALRICQCDTLKELRKLARNSFRTLVFSEDLDTAEETIRRQIAANQYDFDYMVYRIRRKDGSLCWVEGYGHFIRGESIGDIFYVFWGDSSGRRKEQQILQNRILLEALEKAVVAAKAKKVFLSQISHEMYTPLNAILGFTALVKTSLGEPDAVSGYLEQMEFAGHQLLNMITAALEVSSLQNTTEAMREECSLRDIAREVYDGLLPHAQDKSIRFSLDCTRIKHSSVYSDPALLRQLVFNLADNAIAYTGDGGQVDIVLAEDEFLSDTQIVCRLEVRDTGVGMSEEFLDKMFEPFTREKTSTISGIPGIGLGLTIAENIVNLLGGTITVNTVVNEGSVFAVSLPLDVLSLPDASGSQNTPRLNLRILLAEDDDLNREVEAKLLQRMGFVVDTVSNGREALDTVEQAAPGDYDLIILDLQMPVMNGWDVSAAIRKLPDPALAAIPIIALSAHAGFQERRQSLASGIDVHLSKPMNPGVLRETIEKITSKFVSQSKEKGSFA